MRLYFMTSSEFKIAEVNAYLATHPMTQGGRLEVQLYRDFLVEVMVGELQKVVEDKALKAYERLRQPVVIEHGGLFFEGLGDLPGPLGRLIWKSVGPRMCTFLLPGDSRAATARSMLGYCDGRTIRFYNGETKGTIAHEARGAYNQHNWDPIFIPEGSDETYGEMGPERKRETSPMLKAWASLLESEGAIAARRR